MREHDRWLEERQRKGWTNAAKRDNARKHHPRLVPWVQLTEPEKEKDRDTIRNLPRLVERAGFPVRTVAWLKSTAVARSTDLTHPHLVKEPR